MNIGKTGSREDRKKQAPRTDLWALSHDDGTHRWGIMTTNGVESLNMVYKNARAMPVTALVEVTFYKSMK